MKNSLTGIVTNFHSASTCGNTERHVQKNNEIMKDTLHTHAHTSAAHALHTRPHMCAMCRRTRFRVRDCCVTIQEAVLYVDDVPAGPWLAGVSDRFAALFSSQVLENFKCVCVCVYFFRSGVRAGRRHVQQTRRAFDRQTGKSARPAYQCLTLAFEHSIDCQPLEYVALLRMAPEHQ